MSDKQGSIVCVGTGMTLGAHISPLCRSYIEQADVVYCSMGHDVLEQWLHTMNKNIVSLQPLYEKGKDRRETYKAMVDTMMMSVREGKNVVGAFYGHPGVFALAPHRVIEQARSEGFYAAMEPGISAEACLYADMGIDPGRFGCQQMETTQFMLNSRPLDTSGYVILWQIGVAGDTGAKQYLTNKHYLELLVEKLSNFYPKDQKMAIYEARALPTDKVRVDWFTSSDLPNIALEHYSTLIIPPAIKQQADSEMRKKINEITQQLTYD